MKLDKIDNFLKNEENLWLEFKSFWYWDEDTENKQLGWGELLKDFVALFNTNTSESEYKYLIIGFDEITKSVQYYNLDKNNKKIKEFQNLVNFRKEFIDKLRSLFKNTPIYKDLETLIDIEKLFKIYNHKVENVDILVFEIYQAPYLLELKKFLDGNTSFREGSIISRRIKKDSTPEVYNASYSDVQSMLEKTKNIKLKYFPDKEISIKNIVNIFKNKFFPNAEIKVIEFLTDRASGLFFESIQLFGKRIDITNFLYISKYSTHIKVYKYLEDKEVFDNGHTLIIIADKENKDGGNIDLNKLKKLFSNRYKKVEVHYIDDFAHSELYDDMFKSDIFHNGSFNIQNFINPFTDKSNEKDMLVLLDEWFNNDNNPLLVIKGTGGIGKTTVVKYFLDKVYKNLKQEKYNILFINSHEIINEIIKKGNIDDLFDFYDIVNKKENDTNITSKETFQLAIDSGHLTIVLDGLDEVIAKMGSKFHIVNFLESIFKNYSNNLNRAKIIITCRDFFWDSSVEIKYRFESFSLIPFSEEMAKNYFLGTDVDKNKINELLNLAKEFNSEEGYIPYVLDMIKENFIKYNTENQSNKLDTKILIPKKNKTDFLLAKICEREIKKLENLSIDNQIEFFIEMSITYNGELRTTHIEEICSKFKDSSIVNKFNAHPLLRYYENEKILKFRYDFFNEYFKNLKIFMLFKNLCLKDINKKISQIIIQHISLDGGLVLDLVARLRDCDLDELKIEIIEFIENIEKKVELTNDRHRLNSSLFILLLLLSNSNNIEERTNLLKEIYELDGVLNNVSIVNLYGTKGNKLIFDFSDMLINNSYFENYEYFTECRVNEKTKFMNSIFKKPLHRENINTEFSLKNFEISTCEMSGLIEVLSNKENELEKNNKNIRHDLKQIIKYFWSNSTFRKKTKEEVENRLSKYNRLLEILLKNEMIIITKGTSKHKRVDYSFEINKSFSNLRKVMEENETCIEFENIVNIVEKNN